MHDGRQDIPEYSYRTRQRRPVFDTDMRRMAMAAGGISLVVIAVAMLWSGMRPGAGFGAPPVITAPQEPLRVAPSDPGGLTVPDANVQIMSGVTSAGPAQLAPDSPPPDVAQFAPPAPSPAPAPAPAPASAPTSPATPALAPAAAVAVAPPASPVQPLSKPSGSGPVQVQLAALVDQAGAQAAWARLQARLPGLFAGRSPLISKVSISGVTFWRLRTGGFADAASAQSFCDAVAAKGAACKVAAF